MSIAPVDGSSAVTSAQSESTSLSYQQAHTQSAGEEASPPVLATLPNQESPVTKTPASTYEFPEDVVEVHQDPEIKDQIIIQYLNQAKDVVLQVPSDQELSVERGIAQELQQAAKLRETASAAGAMSEGEKTHGNQL
ncbi:MAG: hypothetical protein WBW53_06345 [Terriglobales bacterium]